jgi:predicted dehydrogenase
VIHALQCLDKGKHVLIEKPMALTIEDALKVEEARVQTGKVVFVGYMRRYAQAFLRVKEAVQKLDKSSIDYVRVRDIIGKVSRRFYLRHPEY